MPKVKWQNIYFNTLNTLWTRPGHPCKFFAMFNGSLETIGLIEPQFVPKTTIGWIRGPASGIGCYRLSNSAFRTSLRWGIRGIRGPRNWKIRRSLTILGRTIWKSHTHTHVRARASGISAMYAKSIVSLRVDTTVVQQHKIIYQSSLFLKILFIW